MATPKGNGRRARQLNDNAMMDMNRLIEALTRGALANIHNPVVTAREIGKAVDLARQVLNQQKEMDEIFKEAAKRGPYKED